MIYQKSRISSHLLLAAVAWLLLFVCQAQTEETEGAGLAACTCDCQIVYHAGYTLCYDEQYEQARWVGYELTKEELSGQSRRTNKFLSDPLVRTGSAHSSDYVKSGYDRGHLAPAADFAWSDSAMGQTFFMSNISPQKPGFNRGIWKNLEALVRDWAQKEGIITVITGPVFGHSMSRIGAHKVAVPPQFYKVVLDRSGPDIKAIGFVMPNDSSSKSLTEFAVSVDSVESLTGIDFFAFLPDEFESILEERCEPVLWFATH